MSDPAAQVVRRLARRQETVATAESLTGGLLGSLLTEVPGASAVYRGGVITYATDLKHVLAGVAESTLGEVGPVAARTAREMALGVAERCDARWGVSTTGVAGPDPQDGHPVGQVFVAVADRDRGTVQVVELRLTGGRREIRAETARRALDLLAHCLAGPR